MKKIPKGLCTPLYSVDRKLAGSLLAVALMGGAPLAAHSSEVLGGAETTVSQQVSQKTTIHGTVTDESGEPMIGVSITEVGTKVGVATDIDGNFSLTVNRGAEIRISYIGYKTQTIKAAGQSNLEIRMEPDNNVLDDVVVVGYGTMKKRDLTGAISSVKSDVITLTPSSNPMDALQGRVAGLDITKTSGQPGEGLNIQLRGNRSITASGTPLFIIDGMPGNYETINPNDIESIEVLKDASSTAVYGSEGSNGVVIITTKKGEAGKMRVNFDAYLGVNGWSTTPKMNSPEQNILTRELAHKYSGTVVDDITLNEYKEALARGETIDWIDALLGTGFTQNYSLSLSGGTEKTQAYFSLNYSDVDGQYKNNNYKVYSASVRVNTKLNNWLSGGIHVQASYTNAQRIKSHLTDGLRMDPFGKLYNEDGSVNPFPVQGNTDIANLLLDHDKNVYRDNPSNLRLYVQPYLRITPFKGLTLESRISGNFHYQNIDKYQGYGAYDFYRTIGLAALTMPKKDAARYTNATKENTRKYGYTWENILTYNFQLGDIHDFTITGVTSWNSSQEDYTKAYANSIPSNNMYWTNLGAATDPKPTVGSNYKMHKRMGYVGRINYTLMGKYLFSASVRRDGDSRLSNDCHWATFPAVSAGWRISDENFMESTRTWLNNLKLRVGYGETGGAGINPYDTWSILETSQMGLGGSLVDYSRFPEILANAMLGWERSKSWNIGLDLGLFNNRIDLAAEYYITNTDDVIWRQSIPSINGAYTAAKPFVINKNIASTRNQGIELTLTTHNIETRDFSWTSTLTFSNNKEKVTSLGEGAADYIDFSLNNDESYCLHIGDPTHSYRSYVFGGIWQNGEEADAAVFGRRPGDMKIDVPNMRRISEGVWEKTYVLEDGTVETRQFTADDPYTINADDRVIIGHNTPDWSLGFQNTFTWKWFDLSLYMYFRHGQKFNYEPIGWYSGKGGSFPEHFNYWTPDNPSNEFPALDSSRDWQKMEGNEAIYWVDGSFFKIKNITLGYTLPKLACSKLGINHLRLYGTITNPLVYANSKLLKGYDPEMNGSFNFPLTRQLVFGLNVTF